ncbi:MULTISPECIES: CHAT domain-containing protein [Halorussus]|uniref:CHAT domain-containing protein n=1 Tax=Halorussus TaxID=1070314 RepID=UPI0020A1485F|nr:CHAT domain-containing protein [Halorussus vallis]USZ77055.1 CHAT domain-containing protein [Halorussus vallis]
MHPQFETLAAGTGLVTIDPVESRRFVLFTADRVTPVETDVGGFVFPVSAAVAVETSRVTLPYNLPVTIRDGDGDHVADVAHETNRTFPPGTHLLELSAPIKLYLRVEGELAVTADADRVRFDFGESTRVGVGARSFHTSPVATLTVPDDPESLLRAVSTFSSALKTTTCERSWPTLRGHPPRVEIGDELAIPDGLTRPETGVIVHVPPEYEYVYPVAPLAYYLGADVVPAETPRLTTDAGLVHRLDTDRGFEDEVIRTLQRTFALDCVTRTEGYYPVALHERRLAESNPAVDLDFAALYDAPLTAQLEAYLSVPFEAVEELVPTWHRVTHVRPTSDSAELLPHVVDDLSLVRARTPADPGSPSPTERVAKEAVGAFKRSAGGRPDGGTVRSGDAAGSGEGLGPGHGEGRGVPGPGGYVPMPDIDEAIEQAWVGDGTPERGAKLVREAFEHPQGEPTDGTIDVTVVCNDEEMRAEHDTVADVYGTREVVPFDLDCRFGVETDELRDLLAADTDLFHFIGHIDGDGFECPDGVVDATTLAKTGATTALLNGCRSHDQGVALVERGTKAAVVSLADVGNRGASEVGETLARLLNHGFGTGSALELAREYTSIGRDYVVVGDPSVAIAQRSANTAMTYDIRTGSADGLEITPMVYSTRVGVVGRIVRSHLPKDETYFLRFGRLPTMTSDWKRVRHVLGDSAPLIVDGDLQWYRTFFDGR